MNDNHLALRIILDVVLLFLVFFGWWYIALPLALICAWFFPWYVELVAAGFIYDSIFSMDRGLGILGYLGLVISVVLFALVWLLKLIVKW